MKKTLFFASIQRSRLLPSGCAKTPEIRAVTLLAHAEKTGG